MKKFALEFLRRGLVACGFGPIVLAVLYLVLKQHGVETLTVDEVCLGIFSLTALAFIAGGMNAVYQMERLPLMLAILLHGGVLYAGYLAVFLLNGWLQQGLMPLLVFTVVFVIGYLVIWVIIYSVTKQKTAMLNQMLKKQQESAS